MRPMKVRTVLALCRSDPEPGARGQDPRASLAVPMKNPERQRQTRQVTHPLPANWRNAVDRAEKREFVAELNGVFKDAASVVVAHYAGLTVAQMNDFRSKMRAAGGTVKVAKNRLAKIALQGTESEGIADLFQGQTLIAYSDDPVTAPKVATDFAKVSDKLVIIGGAMGPTTLDADGIKALATMPSLDELRAKLVGMIQTPATRIAQVVNAPAGAVARVIGAYARENENA